MTQKINIFIPDQSDLKAVKQFASELASVGIKPTAQAIAEKIVKNEDIVSPKLLEGAKYTISTRDAIAAIADNISEINYSDDDTIRAASLPPAPDKNDKLYRG